MSSMDQGGSVFPHEELIDYSTSRGVPPSAGLMLRDHLAIKAPLPPPDQFERNTGKRFAGMSNGEAQYETTGPEETVAEHFARWSYAYADAMLAERAK